MITKFKIFESITDDLIKEFDDDFIEKYYDENYYMDTTEIIELWPSVLEGAYDEQRFKYNFIKNIIDDTTFDYIDDYQLKEFIKDKLTPKKEELIVKLYNKVNDYEGDDYEEDYSKYMLDDLDEDQLREVSLIDNYDDEVIEYCVKQQFYGMDADEILETYYSKDGEMPTGHDLYDIIGNYIIGGGDALLKKWKDNADYYSKKDFLLNDIDSVIELQNYILNKEDESVLQLAELFKNNINDYNTVENDYRFQKLYIEQYVKNNDDGTTDELIEKALLFLNKNFELDPQIEEEYKENMWIIDAEKYNV